VAGASACIGLQPGTAPLAGLDVVNNQCISDQTNAPAWCWNAANGNASCGAVSSLVFQNNLLMTSAQASSEGYTIAGSFQPTLQSNDTVGAGENLTSFCGTSGTALCSDRLGVARPTGTATWDVGAYLYQPAPTALAPAITSQPVSQSAASGQSVTFSVIATGSATLGYQWQQNGVNISGATSSTYTTPPVTTPAVFTVAVSNASGTVTSSPAILTVTSGSAQLTPSSSSMVFTNGIVGEPTTMSLTLTSSGSSPVTILGVSETGAGFSGSGLPTGLVLAPGQTGTLNVTFLPTAAGPASGSITISSTAGNPSVVISLSGSAIQLLPHTVTLSWTASTSTVAGYNMYRSTQPYGGFVQLNSSPITGTTFADSTVTSGVTYYYMATSVGPSGLESGPSNLASATTPFP